MTRQVHGTGPHETRACFEHAASAFVSLVTGISDDCWTAPALGEWSVRDLVGHTSRALSTVETYLGTPAGVVDAGAGAQTDRIDAVGYYLAVRSGDLAVRIGLADPAAVTQRGRDAGAALGDDPSDAVTALANRVRELVRESPDDAVVMTALGAMRLADYLPTRTFELTVHTLDLARALDVPPPASLGTAIGGSLLLAAGIAAALPDAADILLLLTGRADLPAALSVV
ncbi:MULTISPECIES: maleylpyruvate isomerase N-terminal domain-containing protein [unclassified Frankia]|uniref:maleylpyruvate isomerase N-terminal domain-containing protein n=1 Tax=unclassified Frankia TaxID=2632575 RepID=UPI001EF65D0C|nr:MULTISPECIES: maleylpyruvate isomerase N-terminal domain-containing protein [unclassified Frankia]